MLKRILSIPTMAFTVYEWVIKMKNDLFKLN